MVRVLIVLAVLAVAFVVVSLVDCAVQPATRHRGVAKPVWLLIIVLLPVIGAVLWFVIGRGRTPAARTMSAPDDDPEFLSRVGLPSDQDERIRRLEEELAQLDAEDADPRWGAHGAGPVADAPDAAAADSDVPDGAASDGGAADRSAAGGAEAEGTAPDDTVPGDTAPGETVADGEDPNGQRHGSIG